MLPMWAMVVKEFRQLRRDRRTLAMMIAMPVLLLVVLGYAASFDVSSIPAVAAGPTAGSVSASLGRPFDVVAADPAQGRAWAAGQLRDGRAVVAVVTGGSQPEVLIDGTQLFSARAAVTALDARTQQQGGSLQSAGTGGPGGSAGPGGSQRSALTSAAGAVAAPGPAQGSAQGSAQGPAQGPAQRPAVSVLYNPGLKTSYIMIPGLAGVVLVFVGTIITSLGVVRERQSGTLEQLAVMPLRPRDVFLGKIAPYFAVAAADLAIVLAVGVAVFGVPFTGSLAVLALAAVLFLFVTLGTGVLISSVSANQGQAIQLAMMTLLPQVLLSGLIFPLSSIVSGVRWIAYVLPLTYFNEISRGVMLKAEPISALWLPFTCLAAYGAVITVLSTLRFRRYLAPAGHPCRPGGAGHDRAGTRPALAGTGDPG